jgi:chromosome segregation ATPase
LEDTKKALSMERNRRIGAEQNFSKVEQQVEVLRKSYGEAEVRLGEKDKVIEECKRELESVLGDLQRSKIEVKSLLKNNKEESRSNA